MTSAVTYALLVYWRILHDSNRGYWGGPERQQQQHRQGTTTGACRQPRLTLTRSRSTAGLPTSSNAEIFETRARSSSRARENKFRIMGSSSSKPAKCGRLKVASNVSELIGMGLCPSVLSTLFFQSIPIHSTRHLHLHPNLLYYALSQTHTGYTPLVRCNLDPESRCDVILKLESMVRPFPSFTSRSSRSSRSSRLPLSLAPRASFVRHRNRAQA